MSSILTCGIVLFASMFSHLGVESGMSQATVLSMAEDSYHNVWFGTQSGLNKYDGYDIRTYWNDSSGLASFRGRSIQELFSGSGGRVYVCTKYGVFIYYPETDSFTQLLSNGVFHSITGLDDGRVIISFGYSLFCFTYGGEPLGELKTKPVFFQSMACRDGVLWGINDEDRLVRMKLSESEIDEIEDVSPVIQGSKILWVKNELWVASYYDGLFRFDVNGNLIRHYRHEDGLCSNYAKTLCDDGQGHLWIGTGNNLSIFDLKTERFTLITPDRNRRESLSHASIKSLLRDSFGGVWVGTYYSGADYYHPIRDRFESFYVTNDKTEDIIGALSEFDDGRMLIGTSRKGVFLYDREKQHSERIVSLSPDSEEDAEKFDIKSIAYSVDRNTCYIGTGLGKMLIFDRKTGKSVRLKCKNSPENVYAIFRNDESHLWLGSASGISCFDERTKTVEKLDFDFGNVPNVFSMKMASDSSFWIGSLSSLIHTRLSIDEDGKPVASVISRIVGCSHVFDIFESSDGKIFVCTTSGIACPDEKTSEMQILDLGHDFSGSVICGILEDERKRLWISSESGLFCYSQDNGFVRRYSVEDGLPTNVFTHLSHLKSKDGRFYFGTVGSVVSFDASEISEYGISPLPEIKSVVVEGKNVLPFGGTSITLPHSKNNITITYSVCNPLAWKNSLFRIKLDGFDQTWRDVNRKREVEYSNLPAGRYVFNVQSANDEGQWCDGVRSLSIRIRPPWYFSTMAVIIEIISILTLLSILFKMMLLRAGKRDKKEIEKLRNKVRENERRSLANAIGRRDLSEEDYRFLLKAKTIVEENIGNVQFNVNDFADRMGISRSGLHSHIKEITGESALVFIKQIRYDYACQLLRDEKLSISEVSVRSGFASLAYFTTSFKNYIGITPKDYRKQQNN